MSDKLKKKRRQHNNTCVNKPEHLTATYIYIYITGVVHLKPNTDTTSSRGMVKRISDSRDIYS